MSVMPIIVDIQNASCSDSLPDQAQFDSWVAATLERLNKTGELTIRIVDEEEGRTLNERWRKSSGPTNVLSFPSGPNALVPELLGDIIICAPVVEQEARQQSKTLTAHWAHMVVHGTLHLLGYDHIHDHDAREMEALEIEVLATLGLDNPYISNIDGKRENQSR